VGFSTEITLWYEFTAGRLSNRGHRYNRRTKLAGRFYGRRSGLKRKPDMSHRITDSSWDLTDLARRSDHTRTSALAGTPTTCAIRWLYTMMLRSIFLSGRNGSALPASYFVGEGQEWPVGVVRLELQYDIDGLVEPNFAAHSQRTVRIVRDDMMVKLASAGCINRNAFGSAPIHRPSLSFIDVALFRRGSREDQPGGSPCYFGHGRKHFLSASAQRAYYEEGRITIDRFLDAASQYAIAAATEAQYKATYNISIVALKEAKGTLLADYGILVAEPKPRKAVAASQPKPDAAVKPSAFTAPDKTEPVPAPLRERIGLGPMPGPASACCEAKKAASPAGPTPAAKTWTFSFTIGSGPNPVQIKGTISANDQRPVRKYCGAERGMRGENWGLNRSYRPGGSVLICCAKRCFEGRRRRPPSQPRSGVIVQRGA
jgi:hypothetical protein